MVEAFSPEYIRAQNLSDEQRLAYAQLGGDAVRETKRWVFWPVALLTSPLLATAINYIHNTPKEDAWNRLAGETATTIQQKDAHNAFATDVLKERTARRTSRVIATGILAGGAGITIALAAGAAAAALMPVALAVGVGELGWVAAKTVENKLGARAARRADAVLRR